MFDIFKKKKYRDLAIINHKKYLNSKYTKRIFFENFLDKKIAIKLSKSFPSHNSKNWDYKTYKNNNKNIKRFIDDERKFPKPIREFMREVNSRQFILFLEALTGINGLIADPYFMGGGIHSVSKGGFLKIHTDFNWHHKLQLHRRINVLFYLTQNWKKKYDGALQFRTPKNKLIEEYEPNFNSCLIFNTNHKSFHGHPEPLKSPKNVSRKILNIYYYTVNRPNNEKFNPTFTNYNFEIKKEKINKRLFNENKSKWSKEILFNFKNLK